MKMGEITNLFTVWWLGLLVVLHFPAHAQAGTVRGCDIPDRAVTVVNARSHQTAPTQSILKQLAQANVVYLGETHDHAADHQAQFAIIQALACLHPQLAIGMEMFQRPYQSVLDQYLAGKLTEIDLQEQSQYQTRWGFEWEFYAPILRFARSKHLPILALNTPAEVTHKVSRSGLDSLTLPERRFIPPRSEIVLGPETYRQQLRQIYDEIHQGKTGNRHFEYFFQAQVLWDETMAERIAQFLQQQPQTLVVVLVGQGHLAYGNGLPDRVARRLRFIQPGLKQISILLNPPDQISSGKGAGIDYFWLFPANK